MGSPPEPTPPTQLDEDVLHHIFSFLDSNTVAYSIRPLNKAAAAFYPALIHLSSTVPPAAFAQRWDRPGSMRDLTEKERRQLLCLTAASGGSTANLKVAIARCGLVFNADVYEAAAGSGNLAACELIWSQPWEHGAGEETLRNVKAMFAAAGKGKVNICTWLHNHHGVPWSPEVMAAAARWGDAAAVLALHEAGCPWDESTVDAAAGAGHTHLVLWLIENGCPWRILRAVIGAAEGGHQDLVRELIQRDEYAAAITDVEGQREAELSLEGVVAAIAIGCDLQTLQAVLGQDPHWGPVAAAMAAANGVTFTEALPELTQQLIIRAVMVSLKDDWMAKVEWLVGQHGFPVPGSLPCVDESVLEAHVKTLETAAALMARFAWQRQPDNGFGNRATDDAASWGTEQLVLLAARDGNLPVLERVLEEGAPPPRDAALAAAEAGHLDALRLLHARGCRLVATEVFSITNRNQRNFCSRAAKAGHIEVVEWLLEALGGEVVLTPYTMAAAAGSGSLKLVKFLRERGCPWDLPDAGASAVPTFTFAEAAGSGCEELVEWMAEQGCPQGTDGRPYCAAGEKGDMAMLECLRRLGCPWNSNTLSASMNPNTTCPSPPLPVLRWMVQQGFRIRLQVMEERYWFHAFRAQITELMDLQASQGNPADNEEPWEWWKRRDQADKRRKWARR